MGEKTNRLNILLMKKEHSSFDDVIDAGCAHHEIEGLGRFYFEESHNNVPDWVRGFFLGELEGKLKIFTAGARGVLLVPIQYGQGTRIVGLAFGYEQWGSRICTPWEVHWRFFDTHHAEFLRALYPGFRALLHDHAMGDAVSTALYGYLRSNRGGEGAGIDSGVILSQASLERLTIAYLEAQGVSLAKTAANLRETLLRLDISTTIPNALTRLAKGAGEAGWKDGPHALTSVRNELTHPKKRLPFKVGDVVYEAWNLSQWYIELIILRLAGYDGEYGNRLTERWVGQVEPVPWAV